MIELHPAPHRADHTVGIAMVEICKGRNPAHHFRPGKEDHSFRVVLFSEQVPAGNHEILTLRREDGDLLLTGIINLGRLVSPLSFYATRFPARDEIPEIQWPLIGIAGVHKSPRQVTDQASMVMGSPPSGQIRLRQPSGGGNFFAVHDSFLNSKVICSSMPESSSATGV